MSLLTKLAALLSSSRVTYTYINSIVDDLYDKIGTTTNGRGSLTWENLSASANLAATQVQNTAAVLGGGSSQAMTNPFVMSDPRFDTAASNIATAISVASAATTVALTEPNKTFQRLTFPSTVAADAVLTTITGATANKVYHFAVDNQDAAQSLFFTNTATNTANSFKHHAHDTPGTSLAAPPNTIISMGFYVFGDLNGSGVNQWWPL